MDSNHRLSFYILLCSLLATPSYTYGEAHFSGFLTLGATYKSDSELGFRPNFIQQNDPDRFSLTNNTIAGIQSNFDLSSNWDGVVQLIYRDHLKNEFLDTLEWAFIRYNMDRNWKLRIGRMNVDVYLLSEFNGVGYAYHWVRPPVEFYSPSQTISKIDGVDLEYANRLGNGFFSAKFAYGRSEVDAEILNITNTVTFNDIVTFTLQYQWQNSTLRASLAHADVSDLDSEFEDTLNQLPQVPAAVWPGAGEIYDRLIYKDKFFSYASLGYQYDGKIRVHSEFSFAQSNWGVLESYLSGYLSLGYQINNLTLYTTVSGIKNAESAMGVAAPISNPFIGQEQSQQLNELFTTTDLLLKSYRLKQSTVSLGTRWDIKQNIALKFQFDHTRISKNGGGLWSRYPIPSEARRVNMLSVNFDMVF